MKELLKKFFTKFDMVQTVTIKEECPVPAKTNGEKLYTFALTFFNTDPTPKDEQYDGVACVHSLTTILNKYFGFPIMTYTPVLLAHLKTDARFKAINEFKEGSIIVSPTESGNGSIIGHTGIIGRNGKILSNSSATGLWNDKYDCVSWVDRYSRKGGLSLYIFEVV